MKKKILISTAVVLTAMATQVSANKYNETSVVNIYNNTLQEVADASEMSLDDFKTRYDLPEDMAGDTNESAAMYNMKLKTWIESAGGVYEDVLTELKEIYKGEGEVDENMNYGDFIGKISLKDFYGEENVEDALKEMNTPGITADTLYGDVRTMVERKLLASSGILSYADEDSILVMLGGKYVDFDVAPVIINERVMVPMRSVMEKLGATVTWDGDTKTVFVNKDDKLIAMQIGQDYMFVNSEKKELDSPATIVGERALIPLRAASEALETTVFYNENTKTVVIH